MIFNPHPLSTRFRGLLAFWSSLRKLLSMQPHVGDFASQRVCPFCGLITPRKGSCCLECGKAFRTA